MNIEDAEVLTSQMIGEQFIKKSESEKKQLPTLSFWAPTKSYIKIEHKKTRDPRQFHGETSPNALFIFTIISLKERFDLVI